MASPSEDELSNSTIRPNLLVRAKSGTITETIGNIFNLLPVTFTRQSSPSPSASAVRHSLFGMVSDITVKDIQAAKYCGGGGFGTVLLVEHPTKGKVALKRLSLSKSQGCDDLRRRTLREGETWQDLKHPHVLPFLGIIETPTELYLVSPYAESGALDAYLRENPDVDRQTFLWQTAGAIAYLHKCGIVHGDIKAANILVSGHENALLCDFGLAKTEDGTTSVGLQGLGTVRFQSPEVLTEGGGKTFASDMWAFGMTIYEVLSAKVPFHQYTVTTAVITAVVVRNERPPTVPSHSPSGKSYDQMWNVAQSCWSKDPTLRALAESAHLHLRPRKVALHGHTELVQHLAFSLDGKTIVSGSEDTTLRLWDVESGIQRGEPLEGHTDVISCLAFSPDSKIIVSGSHDTSLRLWDVESGRQRGGPLKGHTMAIECVAFTSDGRKIISGSDDTRLQVWDAQSGRRRGEALKGHTDMVWCLAMSPDDMIIVSGSKDTTLRLWDVESGKQRGNPLVGHTDVISCLAYSPNGTIIASGSRDHTVRVWDVESGSQLCGPLGGSDGRIQCLVYSPDGETIAFGTQNGYIQLWNATSWTLLFKPWMTHEGAIQCLAFSPDGTAIVSGGRNGIVGLWGVGPGGDGFDYLDGHTSAVTCVSFSPDGKNIASGSWDHTIRLWDVGHRLHYPEGLSHLIKS